MAGMAELRYSLKQLQKSTDKMTPDSDKVLSAIKADPAMMFRLSGRTPDQWQTALLRSSHPRTLVNCCRQSGKSLTAAALALRSAWLIPGMTVLLLAPSMRQSGELYLKVRELIDDLGSPVPMTSETTTKIDFAHGSRIVCLPASESTVRCYTAALLVIDESSRVSPSLYAACRPMMATNNGRLIALSTPAGRIGWWADAWHSPGPTWSRTMVTADQCPRISKAFLAEEREALPPRLYRQEYDCAFEEGVGAVFSSEDIARCLSDDGIAPLELLPALPSRPTQSDPLSLPGTGEINCTQEVASVL